MQVRTECPDGNISITDYCSNLVYRDGTLERIIVDGGYIEDGRYRFFVTDHLGSVRAVTDTDGNELQTLDYYPYGQVTEKSGSSSGYALNNIADSLDDVSQPYRFNGKESQEFAWIPYLDYGARFYSPDATRWTTMDPLAEKYYFISPYAFCSNNPVNFVDPDGSRVLPRTNSELEMIRMTLPESDREYVVLGANGYIDHNVLSGHESNSGNYNSLLSIVGSQYHCFCFGE